MSSFHRLTKLSKIKRAPEYKRRQRIMRQEVSYALAILASQDGQDKFSIFKVDDEPIYALGE